MEVIKGVVESIESKTGTGKRGPWTMYSIKVNGQRISTFRDTGDGVSKVTSKSPCRVCGAMTKIRLRGRAVCWNHIQEGTNGVQEGRTETSQVTVGNRQSVRGR